MRKILSRITIALVLVLALLCLSSCQTTAIKKSNNYPIKYISSYNPDEVIYVIGHLNPDSDTVFSSIAYAEFLSSLGYQAEPAVTGKVNAETAYVLDRFSIDMPQTLDSATDRQFVLVDHSLYSQSLKDMNKAVVLSILDHHAIGDVTTASPSLYLGIPLGSTATIVYREYKLHQVKLSKKAAGMLLSAILSDTLGLKSATTTDYDRAAVLELSRICGIKDYNEYTKELLEAGNEYAKLTIEEILHYDYKEYISGNTSFSIGVVQSSNRKQLEEIKKDMDTYMEEAFSSLNVDMCFLMLTDIEEMDTELLCYGPGALKTAQSAFKTESSTILLIDTTSRKKQVAGPLTEALKVN